MFRFQIRTEVARQICTSDKWNSCLYGKSLPTFSDAIAAVRRVPWTPQDFSMSRYQSEPVEIPAHFLNRASLFASQQPIEKTRLNT